MTKPMPLRISEVLEARGPLTRREIAATLDVIHTHPALRSALRRLEQASSAVKIGEKYKSLHLYKAGRLTRAPITPAQREAVWAACQGTHRADIMERTGLSTDELDRALNTLYRAQRIRFEAGVGWHQREPDRVPPVKSKCDIVDADHVRWMQYWSPDNRQQRRIEQACC